MIFRLAPTFMLASLGIGAAPGVLVSQTATEDSVVRLSLLIDGTQPLEAAANYGTMITVHIQDRGSYGFVPEMRTGASKVQIQVFELVTSERGQARRHVETVYLGTDETVTLAIDPDITVTIREADLPLRARLGNYWSPEPRDNDTVET